MNAYRPDIDGLRALAVVAVVAFHAGVPWASGGFAGVDVFYVVSGYLITSLLAGELLGSGSLGFADFYARRVRRLLPALTTVVVATLLLGGVLLHPFGEQQDLARSAVSTALFASNYYFWSSTGSYFDRDIALRPLAHTWSLAIEEQFYLVWPLLLWLIHRAAARARVPFQPVACAVLAAIFAGSMCMTAVLSQNTAFYLLPARAWELALGALLALRPLAALQTRAGLAAAAGIGGAVAVVATMFLFDATSPWPGVRTLLPTVGTALLIAAGTGQSSPSTRMLSWSPAVYIGRLSYSWYLWHWPLLALLRASTLGAYGRAAAIAVAALALGLAAATYHLIEHPVRRRLIAGFRSSRAALASAAGLIGVTVVVAGGLGLEARVLAGSRPAEYREYRTAREFPAYSRRCTGHRVFTGLPEAGACTVGEPGAPLRLVLWGDSHADKLGPLLETYALGAHVRVLERAFGACPPLLDYRSPLLGARAGECVRFNAAVSDELRALKHEQLDGVVLAARWLAYAGLPTLNHEDLRPTELDFGGLDRERAYATVRASLVHTIESMQNIGLRVLLVAPVPEMRFDTPDCFARHVHRASLCDTPRSAVDHNRLEFVSDLQLLAQSRPQVRLWDPIDGFCDAHWCYAERDHELLFIDAEHISVASARQLGPAAAPALAWAAGAP